MPKLPIACPFSKKACRECGLFRGRHRSLCSVSHNREGRRNQEDLKTQGQMNAQELSTAGGERLPFKEIAAGLHRPLNLEE